MKYFTKLQMKKDENLQLIKQIHITLHCRSGEYVCILQ